MMSKNLRLVSVLCVAAVLTAGCSFLDFGADDARPSEEQVPVDDTAVFLKDAYPEPIATTTARFNDEELRVEVYSLRAMPDRTVVAWSLIAEEETTLYSMSPERWTKYPVLRDGATKWSPMLVTEVPGSNRGPYILGSKMSVVDNNPSPSDLMYAPLPEGLETVTFSAEWMGSVDVPVEYVS